MLFCPVCGTEYIDGTTECSECQVQLIQRIEADPAEIDYKDWVALQDLPGLAYAEMVKEVLEARGIPCFIESDILTGAYGVKGTSAVGGKCSIHVPKKYQGIAINILHQLVDHI